MNFEPRRAKVEFKSKDGNKYRYDACSTSDLEVAKKYYEEGYIYLESGYEYYVDGVYNKSEKLHHFFKLKTL